MLSRLFGFVLEIPALDRLMDYLEARQQREIDASTAQVQALASRLSQANAKLVSAETKEK